MGSGPDPGPTGLRGGGAGWGRGPLRSSEHTGDLGSSFSAGTLEVKRPRLRGRVPLHRVSRPPGPPAAGVCVTTLFRTTGPWVGGVGSLGGTPRTPGVWAGGAPWLQRVWDPRLPGEGAQVLADVSLCPHGVLPGAPRRRRCPAGKLLLREAVTLDDTCYGSFGVVIAQRGGT